MRQTATATLVTLDLGHAHVPVDELRIRATTPAYDRAIEAAGVPGRIVRNRQLAVDRLELEAASRLIQVRIENGDDLPLQGLRVTALARPRALLIQGGHEGSLTVLYGGPMGPPTYDYALVPTDDLALDGAVSGALGPERRNASFATHDTRSFVARHRALLDATLALAAAIVLLGAALAIRHR